MNHNLAPYIGSNSVARLSSLNRLHWQKLIKSLWRWPNWLKMTSCSRTVTLRTTGNINTDTRFLLCQTQESTVSTEDPFPPLYPPSGSVLSTRQWGFCPTWSLSTTWRDTRWRPRLRATTKSPGPWSGSTWERSSTGSARWNSRCACSECHAACPRRAFKLLCCLSVAPTGPGEGRRGQDQGRLRSASGGHAERLPHVGRIGCFPWPDPPPQSHIPPSS